MCFLIAWIANEAAVGSRTADEAVNLIRSKFPGVPRDVEFQFLPDSSFPAELDKADAFYLSKKLEFETVTPSMVMEDGKYLVRMRESLLGSDEAILSTAAHELRTREPHR